MLDLTNEDLHSMFMYDHITGNLYWKVSLTNRVKVGDEVGSFSAGYLTTSIFGVRFQVHRLVWMMFNGVIPDDLFIDHIDGDGVNNRLLNLRLATYTENNRNSASRGGKSKYKGVYWFKRDSKWQAQLQVGDKKQHIGYFDNEEDAAEAYKRAASEIHKDFFHNGIRKDVGIN